MDIITPYMNNLKLSGNKTAKEILKPHPTVSVQPHSMLCKLRLRILSDTKCRFDRDIRTVSDSVFLLV